MTVRELEIEWLSLRAWVMRCVLPSSLFLLVILGVFRLITDRGQILDQNATVVGFFILYFVLVRGGHMLMIRSMHNDLLANYEAPYTAKITQLPPRAKGLFGGRRNIGFTLAKIKRELIDEFGAR